jgi:hypothetical protein
MKQEVIEKYVLDGRSAGRADEQIRQELVVGGYDQAMIDAALKGAVKNQQVTAKRIEIATEVPMPLFAPSFFRSFVILLLIFNVISYWGYISGNPEAQPVTNGDLLGGVIFCAIGALILASLYTILKKIIRKIRHRV